MLDNINKYLDPISSPTIQPLKQVEMKTSIPSFDTPNALNGTSGTLSGAFDTFTEFLKKPSSSAQLAPFKFEWVDKERYQNSPYFKEFGYNPYRDMQGNDELTNEAMYGRRQTIGNVLANGFKGSGALAASTFKESFVDWKRIGSALWNWDKTKLAPTPEEAEELDKKQKDIFNKYAIFKTPESESTIFNKQLLGDMLQQSGFSLGTIGAFAVEEAITFGVGGWIGRGVKLGTKALETTKVGKVAKFLTTPTNVAKYETATVRNALRNAASTGVYEALEATSESFLKKAAKKAGTWADDVLNPLQGTRSAIKEGRSVLDIAGYTVKDARRLLGELNMANTEAVMEGASTFVDTRDRLIDEYERKTGEKPVGSDLNNILDIAKNASVGNTLMNDSILLISNRIAFDGLFKSFGKFGIAGDIYKTGARNTFKVTGNTVEEGVKKQLTQTYKKGALMGRWSALPSIARTFDKATTAKFIAGGLARHLGKFEVSEGLQEILQTSSNNLFVNDALLKYENRAYGDVNSKSNTLEFINNYWKEIKDFSLNDTGLNLEAVKTFLMGAGTGLIISTPTTLGKKSIDAASNRYNLRRMTSEQREEYDKNKEFEKEEIKDYNDQVRELVFSPEKFFSPINVHLNEQTDLAERREDAINNNDTFEFKNIQNDALVSLAKKAYRLGSHDALIKMLSKAGTSMTSEQLESVSKYMGYNPTKETPQQYVNKIISAVQDYVTTREQLEEILPDIDIRFIDRTDDNFNDVLTQKEAREETLHYIASHKSIVKDTFTRISDIFNSLNKNTGIGSTAASTIRVLTDKEAMKGELGALSYEISILEEAEKTPATRKELSMKREQYKALEQLLDKFTPARFKRYISLKNSQLGIDTPVTTDDVKEVYDKIQDYIKLVDTQRKSTELFNYLSDPINAAKLYNRIQTGLKASSVLLQMKEIQAKSEYEGFIYNNKDLLDRWNSLNERLTNLPQDSEEIENLRFDLDELTKELYERAKSYTKADEKKFLDTLKQKLESEEFINANRLAFDRLMTLKEELDKADEESEKDLKEEYFEAVHELRMKALSEITDPKKEEEKEKEEKKEKEVSKEEIKSEEINKAKDSEKVDKVIEEVVDDKGFTSDKVEDIVKQAQEKKEETKKTEDLKEADQGNVISKVINGKTHVYVITFKSKSEYKILDIEDMKAGRITTVSVVSPEKLSEYTYVAKSVIEYNHQLKDNTEKPEGDGKQKETLKTYLDVHPFTKNSLSSLISTKPDKVDDIQSVISFLLDSIKDLSLTEENINKVIRDTQNRVVSDTKDDNLSYKLTGYIPGILYSLSKTSEFPKELEKLADELDKLDRSKLRDLYTKWNSDDNNTELRKIFNEVLDSDQINTIHEYIHNSFFKVIPPAVEKITTDPLENKEIPDTKPKREPRKFAPTILRTTGNQNQGLSDPNVNRFYNASAMLRKEQANQKVPFSKLKLTRKDGSVITGVQLVLVPAVVINQSERYRSHLDENTRNYVKDFIEKNKFDKSEYVEGKSFSDGVIYTEGEGEGPYFIDKSGRVIINPEFNQEELIKRSRTYEDKLFTFSGNILASDAKGIRVISPAITEKQPDGSYKVIHKGVIEYDLQRVEYEVVPTGVYPIYADMNGNYLFFDENGNLDDNGKLGISRLPLVYKNDDGSYRTNINVADVDPVVIQEEMEQVYQIRKELEDNPYKRIYVEIDYITEGQRKTGVKPYEGESFKTFNDTGNVEVMHSTGESVPLYRSFFDENSFTKEVLDSIMMILFQPRLLRDTTPTGKKIKTSVGEVDEQVDLKGYMTSMRYIKQFLYVSHIKGNSNFNESNRIYLDVKTWTLTSYTKEKSGEELILREEVIDLKDTSEANMVKVRSIISKHKINPVDYNHFTPDNTITVLKKQDGKLIHENYTKEEFYQKAGFRMLDFLESEKHDSYIGFSINKEEPKDNVKKVEQAPTPKKIVRRGVHKKKTSDESSETSDEKVIDNTCE